MKDMKKILYTIIAVLAIATSCQKDDNRFMLNLVGQWHYAGTENGVEEDIWLEFTEDGTFEMYQKIGSGPYWYSKGEYTVDLENRVLTGVYSDRYPWKYSYKIEAGTGTLQMTAVEIEGHTLTYTREAIPAEVRDKSVPLTKATASFERHL